MLGFIMWTGAYAAMGLEVVRIFCRMQEEDTKAAFEPEHFQDAGEPVRRIRATRPGHIDLTETDLRKW